MLLKNCLFVTAIALLTLVLPTKAKAGDDGNCSNASLHGSYGLHATGKIISVGADFAAVGRFILDNSYMGPKNLDFAPATRVAHKFSPKWGYRGVW